MRKPYLVALTSAVTVSFFLFVAACHKTKTEDTSYASDHATAEQTFADVQSISDQSANVASGSSLGYKTTNGGCATVTRSGDVTTIDFGTTDCTCKDGRKRRGKIIVTCTGAYTTPGSVRTITFDNFYQNDNKVTGTKTVTNMGNNAQGQPFFNITVSGSITKDGGGTVSANWTRVRTWIAGYNTPNDLTDDVYSITGSGTITTVKGREISVTIPASTPLIVANSCHWVEAGSIIFSIASGETRTLNYGNTPNCDDMATITLGNGTVRDITLP